MAVGETTRHGTVLFEARAGLDRTGTWVLAVMVPLGCLLAIPYAFARNPDGGLEENLLTIGLTYMIVLVTVALTLAHLNARFQVTSTHVVKRRPLRSAVVVPRADIVEAVVTPQYAVPGSRGPRTILLGRNGETLLHSQPLREVADVEALAQAAPRVTHVPVLRPQEARERWPRMLPWSHANPRAGALLGFGIVLGVVVLGVLAAALFS